MLLTFIIAWYTSFNINPWSSIVKSTILVSLTTLVTFWDTKSLITMDGTINGSEFISVNLNCTPINGNGSWYLNCIVNKPFASVKFTVW